jgi:hypothetical protein
MTYHINAIITPGKLIPVNKRLSRHRTEKLRRKLEKKYNTEIFFMKTKIKK